MAEIILSTAILCLPGRLVRCGQSSADQTFHAHNAAASAGPRRPHYLLTSSTSHAAENLFLIPEKFCTFCRSAMTQRGDLCWKSVYWQSECRNKVCKLGIELLLRIQSVVGNVYKPLPFPCWKDDVPLP